MKYRPNAEDIKTRDDDSIHTQTQIYDGSPTVLGGTCHLGQLVEEGFEQEVGGGGVPAHPSA